MPEHHRWKAVATYRKTHDTKLEVVGHFDEISEIATWIEKNPDWRALDTLVITYDLSTNQLNLTQIAAEDGLHLRVVPSTQETPDVH